MSGMGTDEDIISEIIGSRSNSKLAEIIKLYNEKYDEDFEEKIKNETSGEFSKLLVSLLKCARDENKEVDGDAVADDVKVLYEAGEGKWGTDEEAFIRIFAVRSSYHLKELN